MLYFFQILYTYVFQHCPATGMQNGDEVSPSIILAGQALLVKMLIPLEPHGLFGSNFVYYMYIIKHINAYVILKVAIFWAQILTCVEVNALFPQKH